MVLGHCLLGPSSLSRARARFQKGMLMISLESPAGGGPVSGTPEDKYKNAGEGAGWRQRKCPFWRKEIMCVKELPFPTMQI